MINSAYFTVKKRGICIAQWSLPKSSKSCYCLNVQVDPPVFLLLVSVDNFPPGEVMYCYTRL